MTRIEPRYVPPTITHGSGLSRDHIHGPLQTDEPPLEKGRYLFALLAIFAVVATIGVAALP